MTALKQRRSEHDGGAEHDPASRTEHGSEAAVRCAERAAETRGVRALEILDGKTIGENYEFRLSEVVTKAPLTGSTDASWVLLEVRENQQ